MNRVTISESARRRIHRLWDALASYGASRIEEGLLHALTELSALVDAQQAYWLGSVRLSDSATDLARGWRPVAIRFLHPHEAHQRNFSEHRKRIKEGNVDPAIAANVAKAGIFRINIKTEIVPPEWFESEFYKKLLAPHGMRDCIFSAMPIGADIESWFNFERLGAIDKTPAFGDAERAILDYACRPLQWFHRLIALHYGLHLTETPLTDAERRVLNALLGSGTESAIAKQLKLTPATVHTYATRIYRKLHVQGRAGLTAMWLMK